MNKVKFTKEFINKAMEGLGVACDGHTATLTCDSFRVTSYATHAEVAFFHDGVKVAKYSAPKMDTSGDSITVTGIEIRFEVLIDCD